MHGEHDTDQANRFLLPLSHTTTVAAAPHWPSRFELLSNFTPLLLFDPGLPLSASPHLQPTSSLRSCPSKRLLFRIQLHYRLATAMDCFGDFCLACDQQTNGTPFCSQACRLAELDHNLSSSEPVSPIYEREGISQRSSGLTGKGFHLPPAIDFLSYRRDRSTNQPQLNQTAGSKTEPHRAKVASTPTIPSRSSKLSPSSSQTSLSSLHTNQSSPGGISEQAWNELRDYASNFDQVRTLKRRMSTL